VYNAANEACVAAFHDGRIGYLDIVDTIERVVGEHAGNGSGQLSVEQVLHADDWARRRAREMMGRHPQEETTA